MQSETHDRNTIDDQWFKTLVHDGHILAEILRVMPEFRDRSREEILTCLELDGDKRHVKGRGTELGTKGSTPVHLDSVFDVTLPGTGKGIEIIVGVEGQNYIRGDINFNGARGMVTNNILRRVNNMNGGTIRYNVFARDTYIGASNVFITDNVFVVWGSHSGSDIKASHNLFIGAEWGENPLNLTDVTAADVFVNDAGVSNSSDYHFQDEHDQLRQPALK